MIARILAFIFALALTVPALATGDDKPEVYALRVPIVAAPGATLQRLDLSARALVAARSGEMADVRVFNAQGKAVPIARSSAPASRQTRNVALPVLPILGAADALAVTGVSLRIDDRQRASVVRVDGTPQPVGASRLLGILLDARRIADPVSALSLDVAIPGGQPVSFTIETSTDLKDWEPLADEVVYRTSGQTAAATIAFAAQDLRGRYLRVTWQATSRLLSPVSIRSAAAVTQQSVRPTQVARVVLTIPPSSDPHAIVFGVPFAAPIAALEIAAQGDDTVVPVRILGRDNAEQPWALITTGSVFRLGSDTQARANAAFDLHGARYAALRIEADARTAGFVTAPRIAAQLAPVQIAFLASGSGPFTLAVGRNDAQPAFLPQDDFAEAYGKAPASALPLATTAPEADPVMPVVATEQGTPWRRVALWAVLLAGTALLAAMVWLLMRRQGKPT